MEVREFKLFEFFYSLLFIVKLPALDVLFDDEDDADVFEAEEEEEEEAVEEVIITIEFEPDIPVGKISLAI